MWKVLVSLQMIICRLFFEIFRFRVNWVYTGILWSGTQKQVQTLKYLDFQKQFGPIQKNIFPRSKDYVICGS